MFNKNAANVSAEKAFQLINEKKELIILDVRTKKEYESGHIPRARLFPVQVLSARIRELEEHKMNPILVYCASGGRSPQAVKLLLDNNFTEIYHLNRGISSWKYNKIQ
ncbi:MAG: rhodanese-like domain-containing protein [Desulfitobacteriaceae bacterium]